MLRKTIFLITIIFLCIASPARINAVSIKDFQDDALQITLIYANKEDKRTEGVNQLELLLHHYTKNIEVVSVHNFKKENIKKTTHLIFYGEDEINLNENVKQTIDYFPREVIVIGKNFSQFFSYKKIFRNKQETKTVSQTSESEDFEHINYLSKPLKLYEVEPKEKTEIMYYGKENGYTYPILLRNENRYFFTLYDLQDDSIYIVGDLLHDILPNNHENKRFAYLILDDVHPLTDAKKLEEIGNFLNKRKIPYLLSVFPIFQKEEGGIVTFKDAPELLEVLQRLQNENGAIIVKGYTNHYRHFSNDGFEFWDKQNDQMIINQDPLRVNEILKKQKDFPNEKEYKSYLKPYMKKEAKYVEKVIENSIHQLFNYKLYPIGFMPSTYAMSQQGYSISSDYFSMIFGQVQLTDDSSRFLSTTPYITSSKRLNGLTLFPETIDQYELIDDRLKKDNARLKRTLLVRDGVIGGVYPVYLGKESLEDFLKTYEKILGLRWINFKMTAPKTETKKIQIKTTEDGKLQIEDSFHFWDKIKLSTNETFFEKFLWIITLIVVSFVLLFIIFSFYLRVQLKKRLFMERRDDG